MSKDYPNHPKTAPAARVHFCSFVLLALGFAALCGCGGEPIWKSQSFAFAMPTGPTAAASRTNIVALRRMTISPLFQGRSFTYRTAENTYERDSYAGFIVPPERAIEQPIRAWLRAGGACGCVSEPGSGLSPSLVAEVAVNELYGDFRKKTQPVGVLEIHFILYEVTKEGPGRIVLDKIYARQTPMAKAAPAALVAAWDTDLREIMADINSELRQLHFD